MHIAITLKTRGKKTIRCLSEASFSVTTDQNKVIKKILIAASLPLKMIHTEAQVQSFCGTLIRKTQVKISYSVT